MTSEGKWLIEIKKHETPPPPKAPLWPFLVLVLLITLVLLPPEEQSRIRSSINTSTVQPR